MKKHIIFIFLILAVIIPIISNNYETEKKTEVQNKTYINEFEKIDKNQTAYQENATVEDLKKDVGLSGDNDIYEVQTEYDGKKVLTVKANLKFKVAFCGMLKKDAPKKQELDKTIQDSFPTKNGIWVENSSRDKILDLINNSEKTNSKYAITGEGYINITKKNEQTSLDKKIESEINSDKLNILTKSSICYIVDDVTGEILDYNFEKMDKYQTYEYFEDDDKKIIFITENSSNQLHDDDILVDMVNLLEKGL